MSEFYEIINGLAYTKDHVLIYNLKIEDQYLFLEYKKKNLKDFFKQFDKNLRVHLITKDFKYKSRLVIYFSNAEYATKALQQFHTTSFDNTKFNLQPCESINQPDGEKFVKQIDAILAAESLSTENITINETTHDQPSIFILNDDCLYAICKNLCDIDELNFALTCQRFWYTMALVSRIKYAVVDSHAFFNGWSSLKIKIFFQIVGKQIQNLDIDERVVNLYLEKYCVNVKKFATTGVKDNKPLLRLIENMPHLEELQFKCVKVDDVLFEHLKTSQLLRKIHFWKCSNLALKNIYTNFKNLRYLDILRHRYVIPTTEDYKSISENLLQLEVLKIDWCKGELSCLIQLEHLKELEIGISPKYIIHNFVSTFSELVNSRLEKFKIGVFNEKFGKIEALRLAELRKLKFLCVPVCILDEDEIFIELSKLKDLEELILYEFFFSDLDGITILLKNCLKLQRIAIYCIETTSLLTSILKLLQEQKSLRSHCLHLEIIERPSECEEEYLQLPEDSDILKVTYCENSNKYEHYDD